MNQKPLSLDITKVDNAVQWLQEIRLNKDYEGLEGFITYMFGIRVPNVVITKGHKSPMEFLADYFFDEHRSYLVLANRTGGKTLDISLGNVLIALANVDIELANVGAVLTQAQKAYRYFKGFAQNSIFASEIQSTTMGRTVMQNKSEMEVLTGTVTGVNSPHPQRATIDEIDLMPWFILQQALSMTQSKDTVKGATVLTSTRKSAAGTMQRLINERKKRGLAYYKWNIWEVVEKLPPKDSDLYAQIIQVFGNELPKNIDKADGFYSWEDLINKYQNLDADVWESEWLCKKPGLAGIIYGTSFSDEENVISGIDIYERLGEFDVYIFEDFGSTENHPDVLLFAAVAKDGSRMIIFDELYLTDLSTNQIWEEAMEKLKQHNLTLANVRGWVGDYHGITEIKDRSALGAPMLPKNEDSSLYVITNGISFVKQLLRSGRIMITANCVNLRDEFLSYSWTKNADGTYSTVTKKKFDHGPDAIRYGCVGLYSLLRTKGTDKIESKNVENTNFNTGTKKPVTAGLYGQNF